MGAVKGDHPGQPWLWSGPARSKVSRGLPSGQVNPSDWFEAGLGSPRVPPLVGDRACERDLERY